MTARPVGDGDGHDGLREALDGTLRRFMLQPKGSPWYGQVVNALLPVVTAYAERRARERAAEELRYRAEGITARATEADDEDVQAALDDEAARLHARARALAADDRTGQQ